MNHNKLSHVVLNNQHLIHKLTSIPPDQQYFLYQMLLRKYENFYLKNNRIEKGFLKSLKSKTAIFDLSITFGTVKAILAQRKTGRNF